jgi:hypothetical protein
MGQATSETFGGRRRHCLETVAKQVEATVSYSSPNLVLSLNLNLTHGLLTVRRRSSIIVKL